MRPSWITIVFCFMIGVLVGCLGFRAYPEKKSTVTKEACERTIDLAIGKEKIDRLPLLNEVSQLVKSNRLEDAQLLMRANMWWDLETAWSINKRFPGILGESWNSVLLDVYPRLRREISLERFARWPARTLAEMTNFMSDADAIVRSNLTSIVKPVGSE